MNEPRLEMHDVIKDNINLWSTKPWGMPKKGVSMTNPKQRKEAEFKLCHLLRELDIKQKQILKLV
jgi:hypothetical protein